MASKWTSTAILGSSDGVLASIGVVLATASHGASAVVAAVIGLLVAEGLGMGASEFLSDPDTDLKAAAVMSLSTGLPIILVGLPWLVVGGWEALAVSGSMAGLIAFEIAHARGGTRLAYLQTFGVLIGVGALAALAGRI